MDGWEGGFSYCSPAFDGGSSSVRTPQKMGDTPSGGIRTRSENRIRNW